MNETARTPLRRKWWKLLLLLPVLLLVHWLLIAPAEVNMEIRSFSPPDSYSIGQGSVKASQVYTPLFSGSPDSWIMHSSAAELERISLAANGTTELHLNFGLLAPNKVKVTAYEAQESHLDRSIDLWLKYSSQWDVPHTYTSGLLEIPLPRDDRFPLQLLVIEATWYGILGPKAATYAYTVYGWQAVS